MTYTLREHTAGGIIRGVFAVYLSHFWKLFLLWLIVSLPGSAMYLLGFYYQRPILVVSSIPLLLLFSIISIAPLSVSVSDICLGNKPSILRSLRKVSGKIALRVFRFSLVLWIKTVLIGALVGALIGGLAALATGLFRELGQDVSDSPTSPTLGLSTFISIMAFVASLAYAAKFLIVPTVIVLEHLRVAESVKRSLALSRGLYLRNFLLYGMISVPRFLIFIAQRITAETYPFIFKSIAYQITLLTLEAIYTPVLMIITIILYYDMRARKEGYDLAALAEDLRH
jgi:hypothetical protein